MIFFLEIIGFSAVKQILGPYDNVDDDDDDELYFLVPQFHDS